MKDWDSLDMLLASALGLFVLAGLSMIVPNQYGAAAGFALAWGGIILLMILAVRAR